MKLVLLIIYSFTLFFLIGLPVWINRILSFRADGLSLALIIMAWGFIVLSLCDSVYKKEKKK